MNRQRLLLRTVHAAQEARQNGFDGFADVLDQIENQLLEEMRSQKSQSISSFQRKEDVEQL